MTGIPRRPQNINEARALIEALCEESITPEQLRRLEELVIDDANVLAFYIQSMHLQSDLRRKFGTDPGVRGGDSSADSFDSESEPVELAAAPPTQGVNRGRARRFWVAWLIAGAACVTTILILSDSLPRTFWSSPSKNSPSLVALAVNQVDSGKAEERQYMIDGKALAVLTRAVNARWESGGPAGLKEGATLRPGRLRLAEGWVQIELFSGVSLILEGPADLELLSPRRAFCHRGKLRTHVPKQAQGFTVRAPGWTPWISAPSLASGLMMAARARFTSSTARWSCTVPASMRQPTPSRC